MLYYVFIALLLNLLCAYTYTYNVMYKYFVHVQVFIDACKGLHHLYRGSLHTSQVSNFANVSSLCLLVQLAILLLYPSLCLLVPGLSDHCIHACLYALLLRTALVGIISSLEMPAIFWFALEPLHTLHVGLAVTC